jgi:phosphoribosylanthranilate isomerase
MTRIITQIYEVQTPEEAKQLIELGVNHVGSVIVSEDNWRVPIILEIIENIKETASKSSLIPLFKKPEIIFKVLDYYKPDIVHFCDDLSNQNVVYTTYEDLLNLQQKIKDNFPEVKIMRSIPIAQSGSTANANTIELARVFEPVSDFFLTDTLLTAISGASTDQQPVTGFIGITGKTCDWDVARKLVKSSSIPVILAGGISPDNVFDGITNVKPAGVDSCTATNVKDENGAMIRFKKDFKKINRFVKEVRRAEKTLNKS